MTTFSEWFIKAGESELAPGIRDGQQWYNQLRMVRPALAQRVLERPGIDPFYDNANILRFLDYVEDLWDIPEEEHERIVVNSLSSDNSKVSHQIG